MGWLDKPAWSVVRQAELGWSRLSLHNASALTFELVASASGDVIDQFTMTKPAPQLDSEGVFV
eukprot:NODE_9169_length_351_cov_251.581081.p4 GENE.NODE_9169_length_351_cov_251.581081~~NODE_9169_length_351_cov_251.581081.p4  ORF type:complete len:63 (-),score=14.82 NODE_9169_length_351_cov_251.581081:145-333(-)